MEPAVSGVMCLTRCCFLRPSQTETQLTLFKSGFNFTNSLQGCCFCFVRPERVHKPCRSQRCRSSSNRCCRGQPARACTTLAWTSTTIFWSSWMMSTGTPTLAMVSASSELSRCAWLASARVLNRKILHRYSCHTWSTHMRAVTSEQHQSCGPCCRLLATQAGVHDAAVLVARPSG